MSERDWRAVREGDAHTAVKTSANNTPESLIVGVGASGALLAGAAIVFVTLVGLVSFNLWPATGLGPAVGNIELGGAASRAFTAPEAAPPAPADQVSTTEGLVTGGQSGGKGLDGNRGGKRGAIKRPAPTPTPVTPVTPPSPTSPGNSGGKGRGNAGGNGNGKANGHGNGNGPPSAGKSGGPGSSPPGHVKNGKASPGQSTSGPARGKSVGRAKKTSSTTASAGTATESSGKGHNSGNGNAHSGK